MQNILNKRPGYSIANDSQYFFKEFLFLQPKVKIGYVDNLDCEDNIFLTFKGYTHLNVPNLTKKDL